MALQIDYFAAATDEEAARTVDLESGLRSLPFDDESDSAAPEYDVVASQDVDPGLALGYLNELLTGVPVEEFLDSGWPAPVAVSADEQKFVLQVDPGFVALMSTREAPFDGLDDSSVNWDGGAVAEAFRLGAAARNMPSLTRRAPLASAPRPMPGNT